MAKVTRPQATDFGLGVAAALPVAQAGGSSRDNLPADPVEREMVTAARRIANATALSRLAAPGEHAAAPVVATTADQIALSREARESAKDVAELARDQAQDERLRRQEAEERADGAFQAGVNKASAEASTVLGIFQEFAAQSREVLKQSYDAQLQAKDQVHESVLGTINAKLDAALSAKDREIEREREKREEAERRAASLAAKKTWQEEVAERLMAGDTSHPLVRAFVPQPQAAQDDPNRTYQVMLAQGKAQEEIAALADERAARRAEQGRKDQQHQAVMSLVNQATQAIGLFTGGQQANGLPQNGVPAEFPEGA